MFWVDYEEAKNPISGIILLAECYTAILKADFGWAPIIWDERPDGRDYGAN